jgi:O-antigen ligase
MFARRAQALSTSEPALAAVASAGTLLLCLLASSKLGVDCVLAPLGAVVVYILLRRPVAMTALVVGLAILCEGASFGLFTFTSNLYTSVYKNLTPLDGLVVLTIISIGWDVSRNRREPRLPRVLVLPAIFLALAMVAGAITGSGSGESIKFVLLSENILLYLLLLPLAIANLEIDRRQIKLLLGGAFALAIVKAVLGVAEVTSGHGVSIEGSATLTYYEPAANWVITVGVLVIFAAIVARVRPPLWMLLGSPLLVASLVLSYRRSFWIAAVLGLMLVFLLGTSSVGRRMLVPTALLVAGAILLLGSINFQSQLPIVKRATSLNPTDLQSNIEDRYRLDERANVLAEIKRHPISGLGVAVPWKATVRTLSTEHEEGRQYVHFAALYFWLKLGILGLLAYIGVIVASMVLAWRAWRLSREPLLRAFALASLCGIAGLIVIDTTASFTGVDPRFTVIFSAQIGLLAQIARTARAQPEDPLDGTPAPA